MPRICTSGAARSRGHLADIEGAREAYLAAFALAPERPWIAASVVRVATRAARWDVAATTIVTSARARGLVDGSLLTALEDAAAAASAWDDVTRELARAVAADQELPPALAGKLERRVAIWQRDQRNDSAAAEEALNRALARAGDEIATLRLLADCSGARRALRWWGP